MGYTISSTGGTIASYAISPAAPAGLTFNTSTGLLSGTPTTVQAATAYTITATNATGSANATFTLTVTVATCATGGVCTLGQTGPGGGKVFYVHPSGGTFPCGVTLSETCKYLEVAKPEGTQWETRYAWSGNTTVLVGTSELIGTGLKNTQLMVTQAGGGNTALRAGTIARAYRGNNLTDWYLPSKNELRELYLEKARIFGTWSQAYWSSSEDGSACAWSYYFNESSRNNGFSESWLKSHTGNPFTAVRPVRAFG